MWREYLLEHTFIKEKQDDSDYFHKMKPGCSLVKFNACDMKIVFNMSWNNYQILWIPLRYSKMEFCDKFSETKHTHTKHQTWKAIPCTNSSHFPNKTSKAYIPHAFIKLVITDEKKKNFSKFKFKEED